MAYLTHIKFDEHKKPNISAFLSFYKIQLVSPTTGAFLCSHNHVTEINNKSNLTNCHV